MKKIIGIIGVVTIAMTMLLNASLQSSENGTNGDVDLAFLMSTASAQSESCSWPANDPPLSGWQDYVVDWCWDNYDNDCGTETWCNEDPSGSCYGWRCELFIVI